LRELEATKTLAKANLLLQRTQQKLTKNQRKQALQDINELQVASAVPRPTSISNTSGYAFGGFDFSGIDLSGISIGGLATLASGGIVTKPTLALIGEGGESEAVIPLSKMSQMGGGTTVNINVNGGDPQSVVNALRTYMRQNGSVPIRVSNIY
jgi:hypothetical protein